MFQSKSSWELFFEKHLLKHFLNFSPLQILEIELFWITVIFLNVEKDQKEPIQKIHRLITPNVQLNQESTNAQLNNFRANQENVFTGIFTLSFFNHIIVSRFIKKRVLENKIALFSVNMFVMDLQIVAMDLTKKIVSNTLVFTLLKKDSN